MPSPVVQQAAVFCNVLEPWAGQVKPWCQRLAAASFAARCGIDVSTIAEDFDPSKEIGEDDEKLELSALKATRELLGLMPRGVNKPVWLLPWVDSVKAKRNRRQEEAAKGAADAREMPQGGVAPASADGEAVAAVQVAVAGATDTSRAPCHAGLDTCTGVHSSHARAATCFMHALTHPAPRACP